MGAAVGPDPGQRGQPGGHRLRKRDGERRSTTTNTTVSPRPDLRDDEQVVEAGFLGVAPTMVLEKKDAGFVVATMGTYTWETVKALGEMPVKLVGVARAAPASRSVPPTGR